jgi:hypothetical protein
MYVYINGRISPLVAGTACAARIAYSGQQSVGKGSAKERVLQVEITISVKMYLLAYLQRCLDLTVAGLVSRLHGAAIVKRIFATVITIFDVERPQFDAGGI